MTTTILTTPDIMVQAMADEAFRYAYAVGAVPVAMMAATGVIIAIGVVGFQLTNMLPPQRPRRTKVRRPVPIDVEEQIRRRAA